MCEIGASVQPRVPFSFSMAPSLSNMDNEMTNIERKEWQAYPALADERRSHVDTACAAYHLGRKAQTMRVWACLGSGPIHPSRINGRLAWAVADLRRLLCV